ncbi:MAG TPA: hypothetical protein PKE16_10615, partial [Hyphomicrobium sp.]|nr:hypothetical protein [Hyphomicrobium sp.]
ARLREGPLREETRKRLERALWMDRAKMAGIGLAVLAAIGLAFGYEELDLKVDNKDVGGTVTDLEPLVSKQDSADGENVIVRLDDGQLVRVLAYKSRGLKIGDKIQVVEHHHATGRVTHTLR